jgi:HTH-type transcriptional regulator/antitoxin HigA
MSAPTLAIYYLDKKTDHKFQLPITVFKKPTNAKEYANLEKVLDKFIDEVKDNEKHPLTIAMQIIGENLEQYDTEHHPSIGNHVSDIEMVKYLMEQNNLHQKDLADIFGGQANVSRFLNGERPLSKAQMTGLKKQFGISADFFVR